MRFILQIPCTLLVAVFTGQLVKQLEVPNRPGISSLSGCSDQVAPPTSRCGLQTSSLPPVPDKHWWPWLGPRTTSVHVLRIGLDLQGVSDVCAPTGSGPIATYYTQLDRERATTSRRSHAAHAKQPFRPKQKQPSD